jgi:hypothetical protein
LPPEFVAVVTRAMAARREDRTPTARRLGEELAPFSRGAHASVATAAPSAHAPAVPPVPPVPSPTESAADIPVEHSAGELPGLDAKESSMAGAVAVVSEGRRRRPSFAIVATLAAVTLPVIALGVAAVSRDGPSPAVTVAPAPAPVHASVTPPSPSPDAEPAPPTSAASPAPSSPGTGTAAVATAPPAATTPRATPRARTATTTAAPPHGDTLDRTNPYLHPQNPRP